MRYLLNSMSENLLGREEYFLSPKNFFKEYEQYIYLKLC